jgi:thiol-disulfide isomerase/thioredoxin
MAKRSTTTRGSAGGACGSAPRWMVVSAFVIFALLAAVLVYQYLIKPVAGAGGPMRGPSTVDMFTGEAGAQLLYFYMDGCGWCEKFNPEWAAFGRQYKSHLEAASITAEKVDGASDPRATKFGVNGFPTIMIVDASNAVHKFEGSERTAAALAVFVQDTVPAFRA